ncbi:hypothetical protein EYR36_010200 [Pleurotus pulmonarius]|nr:hypothetical protein EYR36_010200 [Pleurotus pulmonarius]
MFKVAVQSAVLSIRQGGHFQYLALVTLALNSIGKTQCLYHGTDAASLTLLGQPPVLLNDGLKTYKRGVVAAYDDMDITGPDLCEREAKAFSQLLRANSLLAFLYFFSSRHSDIFSNLLQKILKPIVIAVYERFTPRNTLYVTTIPTSLFITPDEPLSPLVPARSLFSIPDGVTAFTLYHHTPVPLPATEPMETSPKTKILPTRDARLLAGLNLGTVLGKRKLRDEDKDVNALAAPLVAMGNLAPRAAKENVDPALVDNCP